MAQTAIPCVLMRGGTSRGPYFKATDLPSDPALRDKVLLRVMGSPDARQIDGLGGGTTVTSKVAIVSVSDHPDADIDYLFAQVDIERPIVDTGPTCGNMLSAVAPFAIEEGLFPASLGETTMLIRNTNTDSIISATVQTPAGAVMYEGDCEIAGVPGSGAPIPLRFFKITGSKTAGLLPTGNVCDVIDGVTLSCIDVATPMVIANANDLGKTGYESHTDLEADGDFIDFIENLRIKAGALMGLGDVSDSVLPKFAMVSAPQFNGHLSSRYFTMKGKCHPAYAVSGSICVSACSALAGSVVNKVAVPDDRYPEIVQIEHPSGVIDVTLDVNTENGGLEVISGGVLRTARRLFGGQVYIPTDVWNNE